MKSGSVRPRAVCVAAIVMFCSAGCASYHVDDAVYSNLSPNHVVGTVHSVDKDGVFGTDAKTSQSFLIETQVDPGTGEKTAKAVTPLPAVSASAPAPGQAVFNAAAASSANAGLITWFSSLFQPKAATTNVTVGKQ